MSLLPQPNASSPAAQLKKPVLAVTLNGTQAIPAYEAEINNVAHFNSDTFSLKCGLQNMPKGLGASYWANSVNDQVRISIGFQGQSNVQFILGQVDNVEIDLFRNILMLSGRDLSANFIDNKIVNISLNQTSSQIAAQLAANHNLLTNIAPTTTKIGTYFQSNGVKVDQGEFTNLTRNQSEWDLLIFLAQNEGYDLWVLGNTLNFQPALNLDTVAPYVMLYQGSGAKGFSSFTALKMRRAETLARDVIVIVKSWNQLQQASFTVTYKRTQAERSQRSGGAAQTYSFTVPNLTKTQALAYAQNKAEEITRNERIIDLDVPGDLSMTTRTPFLLSGTGTAFDQKYFPDQVTRTIAFDGYRMKIRAKNHSTQSTVVL